MDLGPCRRSERTLLVAVDVESGGRRDRFSDAVLGDALDRRVVVARRLDGLDAQQGASERHGDHRVALPPDRHPSTASPPVHLRHRVAAGATQEARDAAVDDALVSQYGRQPRSVCTSRTSAPCPRTEWPPPPSSR